MIIRSLYLRKYFPAHDGPRVPVSPLMPSFSGEPSPPD